MTVPFEGFLKGFFVHVDQDEPGKIGGSAPLYPPYIGHDGSGPAYDG